MATQPNTRLPELFTRADAAKLGVSPERPKGLPVRRVTSGVYTLAPSDDFRLHIRAVCQAMGPDSVVHGATALRLWGVDLPRRLADDPVIHVLRTEKTFPTPRADVVAHRDELQLPVFSVGGIRVVNPGEAWLQIARDVSLDDLTHIGDALMRRSRHLVHYTDLVRMVEQSHRRPGIRTARVAVGLCRENTDSWPETTTRLLLVRGGLPCPVVNWRVRDENGRVVYYVDMAYVDEMVAVEYDGAYHVGDRQVMGRNLTRRRLLEDRGWRVISVGADDLSGEHNFVKSVRLALKERAGRGVAAEKV